MRLLHPVVVVASLSFAVEAAAADYDVGDGEAHASIADVPWTNLQAGDVVRIHWREAPYAEQWGITVSGADGDPIEVVGVPGPNGELPVVDGAGATEGPDAHPRGLITIRNGAEYIVVRGLELRGASVANGFPDAASAIYVEDGAHVEFHGLVMHDCGNGFFTAPDAADVLLAGSTIYGNGNVDSLYEHNAYTESDGIVFEHNRFGLLRDGALGTNLKDRSAHTVVRFNLIEGGNRALDLVEPEGGEDLYGEAAQNDPVFVYGNILIKRDDAPPNSQVVHFGGDRDVGAERRNLFFYNNTIFSTRPTTTAFYFNAADPNAVIVNNVFFTTGGGDSLRLLDSDTSAGLVGSLANNWFVDGWVVSAVGGLGGLVESATLVGADPGFVDAVNEDLQLVVGAQVRDQGIALPAETAMYPLDRQFVQDAAGPSTVARPVDGPLDLGAYEFCEGDACDAMGDSTGGADDTGGDDASSEGSATTPATDDGSASASTSATASAEGGTMSTTSAAEGTGTDGSSGEADEGGGGCGCRAGDRGLAWTMLAPLLVLLARRRGA